ncbi:MAG: protein kinase [Betaproteobacteria bacterium]
MKPNRTDSLTEAGATPSTPGPFISVIVGSIGYRKLLTTLIKVALPSAVIEEVDPFSQTMRDSGIGFAGKSDVIVLGGIGTEGEAMSALQRLRERENCPPIIMLTSHELAPDADNLCAAGAAVVLLKDALSQNTLAAAIRQLSAKTGLENDLKSPRQYGQFPFVVDNERVVLAIDGFRPMATLSSNAMAQVTFAESITDKARVVIKIPLSTPYHDAAVVRRFCDRYEYFAGLNGRSVVRYLDAGITGLWPYVVLEYLSTGDLRRRMADGLPTEAALRITQQIAQALVDVHAGGFAHMDLKPENIFFRRDGSLVIIDFNISTRIGGVTKNRLSGKVMGSPFYMSPEQGRGIPVDGRSDLYSAGVILFEMLTGERPFAGENSAQVIFNHLHEEIPLLPKRIRHLQAIVDRLLAKEPQERFSTAAELAEVLAHLLSRDASPDVSGARTVE